MDEEVKKLIEEAAENAKETVLNMGGGIALFDTQKAFGVVAISLTAMQQTTMEYLENPNSKTRGAMAGACAVAEGTLAALTDTMKDIVGDDE